MNALRAGAFCLFAAVILTGCELPSSGAPPGDGSRLVLVIGGAAAPDGAQRTIVPAVTGLVTAYSVLLQKGSTTLTVSSAASPVTVEGLDPGTWTVTVYGLDGSGSLLAEGSTSVAVGASQILTASVSMRFIQNGGTGGIRITLTFPHSVGIDAVDATLSAGTVASPAITAVDATTDAITIAWADVAAGSPILRVFLRKAGVVLAGVTESVWVFRNVTTTAAMNLGAGDFGAAPSAPTGLSVTGQHDGSLLLSWTRTTNIADAYVVRRSSAPGGPFVQVGSDLAFNAAGVSDQGLPASTTFYYQVASKNRFGESVAAVGNAATFTVVAAPVFFPAPGGVFPESQLVTLSCPTAGAVIHYVTDPSTPSPSTTPYTAPVSLGGHGTSLTIKAIAVAPGMTDSTVASATYSINRKPLISSFTASASAVYRAQSVTLNVAASDPDGDALSFSYSGMTASGSGPSVTASAATLGVKTVTVTVDDGHGNTAAAAVTVTVINQAPLISLAIPTGGTLWNNGTDTRLLSFSASDPDGDTPLSFSYSVTSGAGTGTVSGAGSTATYTTGTTAGMGTVHVVVTDAQGAQSSMDVLMRVCGWRSLVSVPDAVNGVPAARSSPSAVPDGNGNVILFGGQAAGGTTYYNDVWSYSIPTRTWKQLCPNQTATTTYPGPRAWHGAAFDPVNGKMIVYGGWNGTTVSDILWAFTPGSTTWSKITPTGDAITGSAGCSIVCDGIGNVLIPNQTNNVNTMNVATSANTKRLAYSINGSYFFSAIWEKNAATPCIVIFGAQTPVTAPTSFGSNAVIADNYSASWWTTLHAGGTDATNTVYPSRRSAQSAIYDGSSMVIFGGNSGGTPMDDVWQFAFSSGTWTKLTSVHGPTGRYYHMAVHCTDPVLGSTMLVFGTLDAGDAVVWQYILP